MNAAARILGEALGLLSGSGALVDAAVAFAAVAGGVRVVLTGMASLRIAEAWLTWARRCDPSNPRFLPPPRSRSRDDR